jgi:hypothetical protein
MDAPEARPSGRAETAYLWCVETTPCKIPLPPTPATANTRGSDVIWTVLTSASEKNAGGGKRDVSTEDLRPMRPWLGRIGRVFLGVRRGDFAERPFHAFR